MLRIGVADLLGRTPPLATSAALSHVVEAILGQTIELPYAELQRRWGQPFIGAGPRAWQPCRAALVALGRLGGREMSYHSDLDLVVVYEDDGPTLPPPGE